MYKHFSVLFKIVLILFVMGIHVELGNAATVDIKDISEDNGDNRLQNESASPVKAELIEKRTSNSKTYQMPDGTYQVLVNTENIHYENERGQWEDIKPNLIDEADFDLVNVPVSRDVSSNFKEISRKNKELRSKNQLNRQTSTFRTLQAPYDVQISKNFRDGYQFGKGEDNLIFVPVQASSTIGKVTGNIITYKDAWQNTDVTLETTNDSLKESIILKSEDSPGIFTFQVLGDIDDDFSSGGINLQSAWLIDSKGEIREVEQTLRREAGNQTYIDVVPDVTDLSFPVIIDPTLSISASRSVYISQSIPYANYTTPIVQVSAVNNAKKSAYIQFNLPGILENSVVSSATLSIDQLGPANGTGTYNLTINQVSSSWTTPTWNSQPSISGSIAFGTIVGNLSSTSRSQRTFLLPKTLMQNWLNGSDPNYGMNFVTTDAPMDIFLDANSAVLSISVTAFSPYIPSGLTPGNTQPASPVNIYTKTPTLQWVYADPNGFPQTKFQVQVLNSADQVILDSGSVTSALNSYTIPAGYLNYNTTYKWKVKVWSSGSTSYSQPSYFKVIQDTTAPSVPTSLRISSTAPIGMFLDWNASIDNIKLNGYQIFNGSTLIGTTLNTSYYVERSIMQEAFNFTVRAIDDAGNISQPSNSVGNIAYVYVNNRLDHIILPNGIIRYFHYDANGNLTSVT